MTDTPETIYLIPGEDDEFGPCMVWCDDPAPSYACDPAEAVEYVRKDKHDDLKALVDDLRHHADKMLKAIQADDCALDPESQRAADKMLFDSTEDYMIFKEMAEDLAAIEKSLGDN